MKSNFDMHPQEIRIAMLRSGITQTDIARECNVTQQMIYLVIEGLTVSDRVRRHIAHRLGIDVKRIWPSTYLYRNN
jgi:lambda repressor-like predicted transcriptional regulator